MPSNKVIGHIILEGAPMEVPEAKIVKDSGNFVVGEGILQTGEEENRNGRCYLTSDLAREINAPRQRELLQSGNMCAENGHPMDTSMVRQQTIDPNNRVARFLKLWMENDNVMGQFKGTNSELGRDFDADLREGILPSWSLRALGTLECVHGRNIVRNLKMITYDRVIYPSHPKAYTQRVLGESATSITTMSVDDINNKGLLIPVMNEQIMSYIKTESANLSSILSQIDVFYESIQLTKDKNHVQLVTKAGDTFIVNLESHIQNEIAAYCNKF